MSTTIESLELQIQSSATSATTGIDSLSSSLSKLRNSIKGDIGLNGVVNQVRNLDAAVRSIDGSSADRVDRLASSLSKLSNLGKLRISASVGNQIRNIASATSSLNNVDFSSVGKLSSALKPLGNIESAKGLQSVIGQLKKLPEIATAMKSIDWTTLDSQITKLASSLVPLVNQLSIVGNAFSNLPTKVQRLTNVSSKITQTNNAASTSYMNLWAKFSMGIQAIRTGARTIGACITQSNKYVEDLNLFVASMGEYAQKAQNFAEKVSEAMGIDPAEWMRNQGVFNTIITGFGVVSDRAYIMSKNLTQLGYDLSSFFNISYQDAMQKLSSGISGELEPLRRLGYDLSVARLQQEAYNLGINQSINSMTQAEKAQLRYYAIMTQVTVAQGDMARTLNAPANQLRVFHAQTVMAARAIGNIFIPALNAILPYAIAVVKAIRMVANAIASLFHFKLPKIDYSNVRRNVGGIAKGLGDAGAGAGNLGKGLGKAAKKAKEVKNHLLGIDELNIISKDDNPIANALGGGAGGGGIGDVGGGDGLDFELPEYNFLEGLAENRVNKIFKEMKKHLKDILEMATAIGVAFLSWKIASGILKFLDMLRSFEGFSAPTGLLGFIMLLSDMNEFTKYLDDFVKNGATFQNVTGMIDEFAGMLGDSFVILGNLKVGGVLKSIQGIGEIVIAIRDISDNGIKWGNVRTAVRGISNLAIGIGLITGNFKVVGIGLTLQGLITLIPQIVNVIKAIKKGDWSVVDWSDLVIGAIETIAGIVVALGLFKKTTDIIGGLTGTSTAMSKIKVATDATGGATEVLNTSSSGLSTKLGSLAKTLGWGLLVVAEVAAAALLIVGAIALLGWELEQVGKAWEPVINNGSTIATAMGIGTGVLVAVGIVTYALGTAGTAVAVNIGIGTLILLELGIAVGLFIAEIWAIGKGLNEIGTAWKPVLNNGDTIKQGILIGTGLLVGIGVVTAALGTATVASAGLLPVAIAIGTALLAELTGALSSFVSNLTSVANQLSNKLYPALVGLNGKLPFMTMSMSNFVDFMGDFAKESVRYTESSAIAGLSSTIGKITGFFTSDPIDSLSNEIKKIYGQFHSLVKNLNKTNPLAKEAVQLMKEFNKYMGDLGVVTGNSKKGPSSINKSIKISVSLNKVGWTSVKNWIGNLPTLTQYIMLKKQGWSTVKNWIGNIPTLSQPIKLTKSGWTTVRSWINADTVPVGISLRKNNWSSISSFVGTSVTVKVNLKKGNWTSFKRFFGLASGGYNTGHGFKLFADGGYIDGNGNSGFWKSIPKYANGTANAGMHGSLFVAGENGAEIVGHLNGQTEVLNKSQISMAMRSAVISGMAQFTGYWRNMTSQMTVCTNAIINSILVSSEILSAAAMATDSYSADSALAQSVYEDSQRAYSKSYSDDNISRSMRDFYKEYVEPTLKEIASDTKKQAEKQEKTIVQIGNRTITDTIVQQQKANGFVFNK